MAGGIRIQLLSICRIPYAVMATLLFGITAVISPVDPPVPLIETLLESFHRHSSLPALMMWALLISFAMFLMATVAAGRKEPATALMLPRMRSRAQWWLTRVMALMILSAIYTAWLGVVSSIVGLLITYPRAPIGMDDPWLAMAHFWLGLGMLGLMMTVLQAVLRSILAVYWLGLLTSYVSAEFYVQGLLRGIWTPLAYPSFWVRPNHPAGWPWMVDIAVLLLSGLVGLLIHGFGDTT